MSRFNKRTRWCRARPATKGGTLLVALGTIAGLSVIAGSLALSLTSRGEVASRSASWHEAGSAAESGVDIAVAEIRRVLPRLSASPAHPWSGWTSSTETLPAARQFPAGVLTLIPPPLVHGGEGNPATSAVVTVEAPAALVYPARSSYRWLRVRAVGTALLPGRRQAAMSALDIPLRHFAFQQERGDLVGRPSRAVAAPEVARAIEVIVRPVLPFEQALLSVGAITAPNTSSLIDSFDSTDSLKSTLGLYDSNKQQNHGSAFTLGASLAFAGRIIGDAGTNGGTLAKTSAISGNVNNGFYQAPVPVATPSWAGSVATVITGDPLLAASVSGSLSADAPARYQINGSSGKLNIAGDLLLRPTYIEIYAAGDINGKLALGAGVQASIYAAGSVQFDANDVENPNNRAASLQIFGVQPAAGQSPSIKITLGKDFYASIYAPAHALRLSGDGEFLGAILAKSVDITGTVQLHYDESLASRAGPVVDYKVASWLEDVR